MSKQQNMHFKECTPVETVESLKSILEAANVEVEEKWSNRSSIDTYSLRVSFKGTEIGANGKGVTKEYARASAYAELFERFQNGILGGDYLQAGNAEFYKAKDEKLLTAEELIESDNAFIRNYFKKRGMEETSLEKKALFFKKSHLIDQFTLGNDNTFLTLPFYSIARNRTEYLPYYVYNMFYTSNGMCAGNTREEALVQGMSEIVERLVQKKIFTEKNCLPDVPENYIKRYPYIYEMYQKLKQNQKYVVKMKDCSYGGKYPVAALCVIEKDTGRYGLKLGCHPDFGVAMERTFTEITQGGDVEDYLNRSFLDFSNKNVDNIHNIFNSFKIGLAQYPYQILGMRPDYEFVPVRDVSEMSNQELIQSWIQDFLEDGYDVLIRDVSFLGFPSYHIIIPGISEMLDFDETYIHAYNTRFYIRKLLFEPEKIRKENCKYIIGVLNYYSDSILENSMKSIYAYDSLDEKAIPAEQYRGGAAYMVAMCHAFLEEYDKAAYSMEQVRKYAVKGNAPKSFQAECHGMKDYFEAMQEIGKHDTVVEYLRQFYCGEVVDRIDMLFANRELLFQKQYPRINVDKINQIINKDNFVIRLYKLATSTEIKQEALKTLVA